LTPAASHEIDLSDSSVPVLVSSSVLDYAETDLLTATSHDVSRSKRITAITCDGECHCSQCQWAEEDSGERFLLNAGKKCPCGRAYLAMQCYNANRRCFNCSITTSSSQSMAERAVTELTPAASHEIDLSESHDFSRSKRNTAITCDGECHCSQCQWAEEDSGEHFILNAGKKCPCGRAYLAMQCYNANRRCFNCSITIV
jgi:hypothetical protein